jgi:hypothetical protein
MSNNKGRIEATRQLTLDKYDYIEEYRLLYCNEICRLYNLLDVRFQQQLCKYIDMQNTKKIHRSSVLDAIHNVKKNDYELINELSADFNTRRLWEIFCDTAYNHRPGNMGL